MLFHIGQPCNHSITRLISFTKNASNQIPNLPVYGPSFYLPALRSPVHVVPPLYGMYSQTLWHTNVDKQRFSLCASRVSRHCTLSGSLDCIIADPHRFLNLVHCGRGRGGEESHLGTPQSQKIPFNTRMITELRQFRTLTSRVLQ